VKAAFFDQSQTTTTTNATHAETHHYCYRKNKLTINVIFENCVKLLIVLTLVTDIT